MAESSGQLGGKDDVRQVQGPRLDTSSPEVSSAARASDDSFAGANYSPEKNPAPGGIDGASRSTFCFSIWQPQTRRWCRGIFTAVDRSAARRMALAWSRERGYTLRPESYSGEGPITEGGNVVNDGTAIETRAMEKVDAMIGFLSTLEALGPHMEGVGQLCSAAVSLQRWGTSMDLQVHGLTRDEYDSFDGEDRLFPPTEQRPTPFWSKNVLIYDGSVASDPEHQPRCEGGIKLTLYTGEPPADPNERLEEEGINRDESIAATTESREETPC